MTQVPVEPFTVAPGEGLSVENPVGGVTTFKGMTDATGGALTALEGVAVTTTTTADAYTAGLANEAGNPGWKPTPKVQANAANAALIATNAVLAQVLPAFQLDAPLTYSESAAATELNSTYLNQLYDGGATTSPAVAAAVPASTASIQLQVPLNFLAVAEAANSVATSAWVAAMGVNSKDPPTTQGMAVSTAASETAAYVTSTSQALPQASKAAKAVANAVASALTQGAAAAATAGSMAVSAAVASALNLPTTNGAIVALLSGEQVAVAAWTAGSPTTVAAAVSAAPSLPAAQAAVGPYSDLGASPTAEAGGMAVSGPLVTNIAGALPTLTLYAANAGEWANGSLTVALNTNGITSAAASAMQLTAQPGWAPFGPGDFFNLVVGYTAPDGSSLSESWNMVSLRPDAAAQRIDRVLANSILIQYWWPGYVADSTYPTGMPGPLPVSGAWGMAGVPALPLPPLYGAKPGSLELALSLSDALLQGTPSAPLQMTDYLQDQSTHTGIYALDLVDQFDLMCIPPDLQVDTLPPTLPNADPTDQWRLELYQTAAVYCQGKYAMLILDPPSSWTGKAAAGNTAGISINDLGTYGPEGEYAAVYFPLLVEGNPTLNGQLGYFAPSGAIAGIMARTDASRGVWKAPAGINDGAISGTAGLELKLSDADSGLLNPQGINCLRTFPTYGNVVWGARTLKGADVLNSDYKYVPVRRLALYIEASLLRGLQWAVFEPNADPLWSSIRLSVNSFMNTLFRQGAFAGATAKDAYFVACDATTTTQTDIEQGIVNVTVGFAPLLPAEFVVITIQQMAGQTPT
ncbi:MAG TPA: phage tail sheath C-terminal domain-containing protein [Longimicrobiaceae bacterium]|nr:phage tail sheath C-terminal domain-containing protein [Longimicrobiaceae bacterium]